MDQSTTYGFGQMGSAYTDLAKPIVPPQGMVIVAIQFLAAGTPTVLTPEKLDHKGPGYVSISGSTTDVVMAADEYMNFNGITRSTCTGARSTHAITNDTITISAVNPAIQVGQYVLLVLTADHEGSGLTIDVDTPVPIYSGPNKQGLHVTNVDGVNITLSDILATNAPSSQDLIFLGPEQGAGGITAAAQVYPVGTTIYGRWTRFQNDAAACICYFGY